MSDPIQTVREALKADLNDFETRYAKRVAARGVLDRIEAVVKAAREYRTDFVTFDASDGYPASRPMTAGEKSERHHRLEVALAALDSQEERTAYAERGRDWPGGDG